VMAKMRAKFVGGAFENNGMPEKDADALFTLIEKFAGYAFNKSHSAAYAVISFQTAFLKTYFPVEFMAALLSTEMRTQENVVKYIQSAREHGMMILPPDVSRSERDFSVETLDDGKQAILFGLGAVKGLGDAAIDAIITAREKQSFGSLFGFCEKVDGRKINRKVLEALIKSGACDCFDRPRSQLFTAVDRALEVGSRAQKDLKSGQTSLFAAFAQTPVNGGAPSHSTVTEVYDDIPEWSEKEKLRCEKEAVGFYITGHPLDRYADDLSRYAGVTTASLAQFAGRSEQRFTEVAMGGVVAAIREKPLKNGNGRMAFVTLEDLHGTCEVLVFSKVFAVAEDVLKCDEPILVRGVAMVEGDEQSVVKLRATGAERLADARAQNTKRVEMEVPVFSLDNDKLVQLKEILTEHRGKVPARLTITAPRQFETIIALPEHLRVNPSDELLSRVDGLFGQKVVRLR